MQTRKEELTETLIEYLLAHGLSELSLRPLAAELGTSARLLIYHFGSKDGLLAAAMDAMHSHLRSSLQALATAGTPKRDTRVLRQFWDWAIAAENFPHLKLLYELQILAARQPETYGPFWEQATAGWLELIKGLLPADKQNAAIASLPIAVFDGLFLELMTMGDRQRTTRALDYFIDLVEEARLHRAAAGDKQRRASTRKHRPR
jgi:AcrR family transcriptional regulator